MLNSFPGSNPGFSASLFHPHEASRTPIIELRHVEAGDEVVGFVMWTVDPGEIEDDGLVARLSPIGR